MIKVTLIFLSANFFVILSAADDGGQCSQIVQHGVLL